MGEVWGVLGKRRGGGRGLRGEVSSVVLLRGGGRGRGAGIVDRMCRGNAMSKGNDAAVSICGEKFDGKRFNDEQIRLSDSRRTVKERFLLPIRLSPVPHHLLFESFLGVARGVCREDSIREVRVPQDRFVRKSSCSLESDMLVLCEWSLQRVSAASACLTQRSAASGMMGCGEAVPMVVLNTLASVRGRVCFIVSQVTVEHDA